MKQIRIDEAAFEDVVSRMNELIVQGDKIGATYENWADLYQYGYNMLYNIILDGMEESNNE